MFGALFGQLHLADSSWWQSSYAQPQFQSSVFHLQGTMRLGSKLILLPRIFSRVPGTCCLHCLPFVDIYAALNGTFCIYDTCNTITASWAQAR